VSSPWPTRERRAFICLKCAEKGQAWRVFLYQDDDPDYVPRCPQHGRMTPQENKPYPKRK
jgi:hypothetical protein